MGCYIRNIISDDDVRTDIKLLIPEATVRRRMSRVLKMAVTTAVECCQGLERMATVDAIITSTGYGCLADSEKFLRNVIGNQEKLLNPTPFIQSTFNTVGGQIALLSHNHGENITYVNRAHSFEDALLDAFIQLQEGESRRILVGSFDEITESADTILHRMGLFRKGIKNGEGAVFAELTSDLTEGCQAEILRVAFPHRVCTEEDCRVAYASGTDTKVIMNTWTRTGCYPTVTSRSLCDSVRHIESGEEVIICNTCLGMNSTVIILKGL